MQRGVRQVELYAGIPAPFAETGSGPDGLATTTRLVRRFDERFSVLTLLLVTSDLLACAGAVALTRAAPHAETWVALAVVLCCRAFAQVHRSRLRLSWFDDVPRELLALSVATGLLTLAAGILGRERDALEVILLLSVAAVLGGVLRALVFQVTRTARRRFGRGDRTVVVGSGPVAVEITQSMLDHPEFGLRPAAMLHTVDQIEAAGPDSSPPPVPVVDGTLAAELHALRPSCVVFACPETADRDTLDSAILARRLGCTVLLVPQMSELYRDGGGVERLRSYPLVRLAPDPTQRVTWWVKRAVDVAFALLGLVLAAPLLAVAAVAILVESGRPVLFAQHRIGLDGVAFTLYKLRSLRPADDAEQQTTWTIARDPRIGPVGRWLRRTSVDELPQLWNIVRGDMSLVGPRPERPTFVREFCAQHERYAARHRVPTGLTGLAQVNGLRGDTSIADRVRHDNYYIANWSLWLDVRILLLTVRQVLRGGQH